MPSAKFVGLLADTEWGDALHLPVGVRRLHSARRQFEQTHEYALDHRVSSEPTWSDDRDRLLEPREMTKPEGGIVFELVRDD